MYWTRSLLLLSSLIVRALSASNTTGSPAYKPTAFPIFQLSSDTQFAFYLEEALSLANNGGANSGEVLRIATQIVPNDFESTYTAFNDMAEHIESIAASVNITKDPVSARDAYFRAATYYRGADFFLLGNWSDPRIIGLWDKALASFDNALALLTPVPGERFNLSAHSSHIGEFYVPIVWYKARNCNDSTPTVIVGNGYDGSQEESYHSIVRQMLLRGLNVITYEGPGQPTVRRYQNKGFIPDWWSAVTPVVDWLYARPEVDKSKIALYGLSFGGVLAPIAASHEPRITAVICNDGVHNLWEAFDHEIPTELTDLYSTNKTEFDEVMLSIAANNSYPSDLRWLIDQSLYSFNTESASDWWTRFQAFALTPNLVKNLHMPVFLAKGQDDSLTRQQPEEAYRVLTTERANGLALTTFYQFNTSLGAGEHCALGAESQAAQVILDWLSDVWGGIAWQNHN